MPSLEALGILLEAKFSCPVKYNYLASQRMYVIKTMMAKIDATKAQISEELALMP